MLTIEDGTGVENADSYATDAELTAFATARGLTVPATESEREVLLRLAFDYIEAFRSRFTGTKTYEGNTYSQFPRTDLVVDNEELATTAIPLELKKAQMQLAVDADSLDLSPSGDGRVIIREKIDVLETEYGTGGSGAPQPIFAKADAWIAPLLKSGGFLGSTLRV